VRALKQQIKEEVEPDIFNTRKRQWNTSTYASDGGEAYEQKLFKVSAG